MDKGWNFGGGAQVPTRSGRFSVLPQPMKIILGTFACFCIESRFGPDLGSGAEAALRHYAGRVRSDRKPPPPPPLFLLSATPPDSGVELELTVEPEVREVLELEALRREVYLEGLLAHAIFVYFADHDSDAAERFDFPRGAAKPARGAAKEAAAKAR